MLCTHTSILSRALSEAESIELYNIAVDAYVSSVLVRLRTMPPTPLPVSLI